MYIFNEAMYRWVQLTINETENGYAYDAFWNETFYQKEEEKPDTEDDKDNSSELPWYYEDW